MAYEREIVFPAICFYPGAGQGFSVTTDLNNFTTCYRSVVGQFSKLIIVDADGIESSVERAREAFIVQPANCLLEALHLASSLVRVSLVIDSQRVVTKDELVSRLLRDLENPRVLDVVEQTVLADTPENGPYADDSAGPWIEDLKRRLNSAKSVRDVISALRPNAWSIPTQTK